MRTTEVGGLGTSSFGCASETSGEEGIGRRRLVSEADPLGVDPGGGDSSGLTATSCPWYAGREALLGRSGTVLAATEGDGDLWLSPKMLPDGTGVWAGAWPGRTAPYKDPFLSNRKLAPSLEWLSFVREREPVAARS